MMIAAVAGIFRLKSVGYIVDDLPQNDRIYTDLKFLNAISKGDAAGNPRWIREKLGYPEISTTWKKARFLAGFW